MTRKFRLHRSLSRWPTAASSLSLESLRLKLIHLSFSLLFLTPVSAIYGWIVAFSIAPWQSSNETLESTDRFRRDSVPKSLPLPPVAVQSSWLFLSTQYPHLYFVQSFPPVASNGFLKQNISPSWSVCREARLIAAILSYLELKFLDTVILRRKTSCRFCQLFATGLADTFYPKEGKTVFFLWKLSGSGDQPWYNLKPGHFMWSNQLPKLSSSQNLKNKQSWLKTQFLGTDEKIFAHNLPKMTYEFFASYFCQFGCIRGPKFTQGKPWCFVILLSEWFRTIFALRAFDPVMSLIWLLKLSKLKSCSGE